MLRATKIIRELDPAHPIEITHAPRGTVDSLRPYNVTTDIVATDIYPIGYPPGGHSLLPNKEMSMFALLALPSGKFGSFKSSLASGENNTTRGALRPLYFSERR